MTPDRRRRQIGARTRQAVGVAVAVVLIVAAVLLSDAPVWVVVGVAGAAAVLLALRWWGDHRRGRRWF